jgi:uncharacterized protein involved in exopolysaccharide biosynthesis
LHVLANDETVVGRGDDADIALDDSSVSSHHARIRREHDGYHIADMGSRNGVLHNGVLVGQRRLRNRDRIQLGETPLIFLEEGQAENTLTIALPRGVTQQAPADLQTSSASVALDHSWDQEPESEDSIRDMVRTALATWRFVRRNIWAFAVTPAIGLAAGFFSVEWAPPDQTANAMVMLEQAERATPVADARRFPPDQFFRAPERNFVNVELVSKTLSSLGVEDAGTQARKMLGGLALVEVNAREQDGIYRARFSQPQKPPPPFSATDFLNAHLDTYLQREVERAIRVIKAEEGFVKKELQEVEDELSKLDEELSTFRKENINSLPEQASAAMSSRLELARQKSDLELQAQRARIEVANIRQQLSKSDAVVTDRVADVKPLQNELDAKRRELGELKARGLMGDHPDVRAVQTQIDALTAQVNQKLNSSVSDLEQTANLRRQDLERSLRDHEAQLKVAESGLAMVQSRLGTVSSQVADIPEVEAKIRRLSEQRGSLQRLRAQLFENHRQKAVQIDLETANVKSRYEVLRSATLEESVTPKFLAMRLGGGFAVGLALALAIAGWFELRRYLKEHPEVLNA